MSDLETVSRLEPPFKTSPMGNDSPPPVESFGWSKFRPKTLQRFCNAKWALFWLCWGGALQGLIVNGFINVVISTIERRFGLRSKETGLVASGYDIASFICLVPVTYFGGRVQNSKPHIIGWGVILLGLGSLTFALPHFLVPEYRANTGNTPTCTLPPPFGNEVQRDNISSSNGNLHHSQFLDDDGMRIRFPPPEKDDGSHDYSWTMWLFFVAQLMHGAGAAPLFTLGVTYIDENVSKKMSSVYLGVYYTMAMIGPAMGYVIGGQLLLIYTDFLHVDANEFGLTSDSQVWIGAWWIGFVVAAICCFLLAIPIFAYPKSLPGSIELQQNRVSEAYNGNVAATDQLAAASSSSCITTTNTTFTKWRELPMALNSLLKNPTFVFLNLAGATEGLTIAGFAAFLPKQIENQFSVSPVWAALLMGLITVPAGGGGTFLGGYLVKRFNLSCSAIIRLCLLVTTIAVLFTSSFLFSCPNGAFAGVTVTYEKTVTDTDSELIKSMPPPSPSVQLESGCNRNCSCNRAHYDPICGVNGVMYYNACFAGCTGESSLNDTKFYTNCGCIQTASESKANESMATNTMCPSRCTYLPYFVVMCFILMLFTFLATMPALSATLRCVYDDQRSFALGIQWIKVRLLGTIPAPMIFGALIDETCLLWQESTTMDQAGACLIYENGQMSWYMWILAMVGKFCSALFFFAAWWCYRPPKSTIGTENPLNISVVEEDLNAQVTRTNRVHQTLTTEARDSRPCW